MCLPVFLSPHFFSLYSQVCCFLSSPFVYFSPFLTVSPFVSLPSLFVNLSLSVFQSRCLFPCPTLPHVFLTDSSFHLCPHALFVLVFLLQIFMPLGIYIPSVIILPLLCLLCPFSTPSPLYLFSSYHFPLSVFAPPSSLFFSVAHGVQCRRCWQEGGGGLREERCRHFVYCISVLMNMALTWLVINAAQWHAYCAWWCWSCMIYKVRSHTGRGPSYQLSVFLSEGIQRVAHPDWLAVGVTDRPPGTGLFLLMADGPIWHSLNLTHTLTEWKHISLSPTDVGHAQSHISCRGEVVNHNCGNLLEFILLSVSVLHSVSCTRTLHQGWPHWLLPAVV